ncbi:hypothetical protein PPYR_08218 [Photinus pyralis]|uniref:FHA domain-containing protein n=2 Tax=Photinus pyralis TaxID=7054 RepID=A0A5N4AIT5_PHOPY|nr:hypothetical protein PPYR_08218 [Photinus pyralis]
MEMLPSELLPQNEIDRLNNMFGSPKKHSKKFQEAKALLCPIVANYFNLWCPEVDPALIKTPKSLAGHKPVASPKLPPAIPVKHRVFTFGIGNTNDVPLDRYGDCQFVSPKHAVVFYDEMEKQYELVNYSCFGTFVNNTLAANNESNLFVCEDLERGETENEEFEDCVNRTDSTLNYQSRLNNSPGKLFTKRGNKECYCEANHFETLTSGWEGSVPVPCGSILRFGCIRFIFSVINDNVA